MSEHGDILHELRTAVVVERARRMEAVELTDRLIAQIDEVIRAVDVNRTMGVKDGTECDLWTSGRVEQLKEEAARLRIRDLGR